MKIDKLLAIIAFILIGLALWVIAATGPASGYEISIYAAYPPYFWFFIIGSIACGIYILVRQAFAKERSNWWLTGLLVILLANGVLLLLPFFRGYFAHGYFDPLNQIGLIRDIELTGHFGAAGTRGENPYPALHILVLSISYMTHLEAELVVKLIPFFFFTFYTVSMYLLSKEVTQSHKQSLLITAFSALPLYMSTHNENMAHTIPRIQTFFLMPFILYLLFKLRKRRVAFVIPFILLLLVAPIWHPADGGPFLVGIFLTLGLSYRLCNWLTKRRAEAESKIGSGLSTGVINPVLILFVTWLIWFSAFRVFELTIEGLGDWIIYGIWEPEIFVYLGVVERAEMPLLDIIMLTLKRHGAQLAFFLLSIIISLVVWRRFFSSKNEVDPNLVVFSFLFMVAAVVGVSSLVAGVAFGYTRFIPYVVFGSVLVNGLGLYLWFHRLPNKAAVVAVIMLFLLIPLGLGTFNVYSSPFVAGANGQVTSANMKGLSWFLEKRDEELIADQITFTQFNHTSALLGRQSIPKNIRWAYEVEASTPEHFGFPEYGSYGAAIDKDRYFLSSKLDRIFYSERIPEYQAAWRWSPADFERLENDSTVNRVYNSGEFEVFYVRSQQHEARH